MVWGKEKGLLSRHLVLLVKRCVLVLTGEDDDKGTAAASCDGNVIKTHVDLVLVLVVLA